MNKSVIYYFSFTIYLLFGIASIIIGADDNNSCDSNKEIFLNIKKLLLITGSGSIFFSIYYLLTTVSSSQRINNNKCIVYVVTFLHIIFIILWYVLGYLVLNDNNWKCIREKSFGAIYALITWAIIALYFMISQAVYNYYSIKNYIETNNSYSYERI